MSKICVVTLGFMNWRIISESFKQLYATKTAEWKHLVLDQHYPLNEKENRDNLKAICKDYGAELFDAGKNLGLHNGVNYLLSKAKGSEIVIGYDPDSFPNRIGWDTALTKVINPTVVWSTLGNPRSLVELKARGYEERVVDNITLWRTKRAVVNSVCAWYIPWLDEVGLTEPRAFYGLLEMEMFDKLRGKEWVFLPEYTESDHLRLHHDKDYVLYKWAHAILKVWDGDFKTWLAAGKPQEKRK